MTLLRMKRRLQVIWMLLDKSRQHRQALKSIVGHLRGLQRTARKLSEALELAQATQARAVELLRNKNKKN